MTWQLIFLKNLQEFLINHHSHTQPRDELGKFSSGSGSSGGNISVTLGPKGVKASEFNDWEGLRQVYAKSALTNMKKFKKIGGTGVVVRDGEEVVGVSATLFAPKGTMVLGVGMMPEDMVLVDRLATKRTGYGRTTMREICKVAVEKNASVLLDSDPKAKGFYEKIGMKSVGTTNFMRFTKEQVAELAKGIDSKSLKKNDFRTMRNEDLEPTNGVFTVPLEDRVELKNKEGEK